MRFVAGLLLVAAMASSAGAQETQTRVVQGCVAAITAYLGSVPAPLNVIEDFTKLDPPRARIHFGKPFQMTATCEFKNRETPLGLVEFCLDSQCMSAGQGQKRFEELELLFNEAGF